MNNDRQTPPLSPAHERLQGLDNEGREQTEKEPKKRETLLEFALGRMSIGAWDLNLVDHTSSRTLLHDRIFGYETLVPNWTYEAFLAHVLPEDMPEVDRRFQEATRAQSDWNVECRIRRVDGEVRWIFVTGAHAHNTEGKLVRMTGIVQDITERKQAEAYREMGREILQILNEPEELHASLQRVISKFKTQAGFDAAGIRLQDGEDFPYFVQDGFSNDFLLTQNSIIGKAADGAICRNEECSACLECTCGLVISGKVPQNSPIFTPGGSFWTNESLSLLSIPPDEDPRRRPRNICVHNGYASFALVPIRNQKKIVGLLQLNDHRQGRFSRERVEILEGIATNIGLALMRRVAEERLHETKALLQAAFDNSQAGIAIADAPDGRLRYVNKAGLLIRGMSEQEEGSGVDIEKYVPSWMLLDLDGTPLPADQVPLARAIKYGEKGSREFIIRRPDNEDRIVWANAAPIFDGQGKVKAGIVVFHDITERKVMEGSLQNALIRAESAANVKADFLSVMSHELRTPLNGVLGFAELLTYTSLNEKQQSYAQAIRDSGNHLLTVVNDILEFTNIEKGRLILGDTPISVAGLLKSSELALRKSAVDKGLVFRCTLADDVPEVIAGDERRICQILFNLLENAIHFTSNGSVDLLVAMASNSKSALDFTVRDTGIGMSPETIGKLFEPFTQGDSTATRQFGGIGLGLAIAKRLAENMNGSILVTSSPGMGSSFTFRFPLNTSPSQEEIKFAPPASGQQSNGTLPISPAGALVLIVEDLPSCSMHTGKMLELLGYQVEFAINGHEGLQAFRKGKFSAILMDMRMPVMDGLVATKKIREVEAVLGGHVPIIALTANVMPGDQERCIDAGMDGYLSKPFSKTALAEKLALFIV